MIPLLAGFVVIPLVIACAALTLDSPISPEQATHLNYAARGLLLAFALLEFVSARLFRTVFAAECHGFR
jgi:hypothetical protein